MTAGITFSHQTKLDNKCVSFDISVMLRAKLYNRPAKNGRPVCVSPKAAVC